MMIVIQILGLKLNLLLNGNTTITSIIIITITTNTNTIRLYQNNLIYFEDLSEVLDITQDTFPGVDIVDMRVED